MECLRENGIPSLNFVEVEIDDKFYFETTCENGHRTITLLQAEKFEMLFESGSMAMIDGYYREAISSIASSVERFHEFCLKVVSIHHNMDKDEFNNIWNNMKNQSERQLGAFYYMYLSEFKIAPPKFIEKNAAFRNSVIHKGYIPNRDEAYKYIEEAYKYIIDILKILKTQYGDSISKLTLMNLKNAIPINNKLPVSTMAGLSILGLISHGNECLAKPFSQALKELEEKNKFLRKHYESLATIKEDNDIKIFTHIDDEIIIRAHYDVETGEILGFYPSNIQYSHIPAPVVDLTMAGGFAKTR